MVPSASTSQRREIALKQVSYPVSILSSSVLDHKITYFVFLSRNRTLPTACSPSPSKSLRMKARKQVLLERLESHRQRLEQNWKICRPSIKIRPNWLMTPIQLRPCSRLSEAKFLPMPRRSSSRLHTWRVGSFSVKRLLSALPIELLTPSSQKR